MDDEEHGPGYGPRSDDPRPGFLEDWKPMEWKNEKPERSEEEQE